MKEWIKKVAAWVLRAELDHWVCTQELLKAEAGRCYQQYQRSAKRVDQLEEQMAELNRQSAPYLRGLVDQILEQLRTQGVRVSFMPSGEPQVISGPVSHVRLPAGFPGAVTADERVEIQSQYVGVRTFLLQATVSDPKDTHLHPAMTAVVIRGMVRYFEKLLWERVGGAVTDLGTRATMPTSPGPSLGG